MVPLVLLLCFAISAQLAPVSFSQLVVGFYDDTCPQAESIVSNTITAAANSNPRVPAQLLRLHFHDCFVGGCDASILINGGPNSEINADAHQGVGGSAIIENAKSQLEAVCPGVVSCSDIIALAARDAIDFSNGPRYEVPTGRRDGTVSDLTMAANMPDVDDTAATLKDKFRTNGFSERELVLLSASHTIGTTACFFMTKRLFSFSAQSSSDPSINPAFIAELQATCPLNGDINVRLPMDRGSELTFDRSILQNIRNGFAVLASDARLYEDPATRGIVDFYLDGDAFEADYVAAIVKLGTLGALTGDQGQVRRVCSAVN